jgi:hypothetical protein
MKHSAPFGYAPPPPSVAETSDCVPTRRQRAKSSKNSKFIRFLINPPLSLIFFEKKKGKKLVWLDLVYLLSVFTPSLKRVWQCLPKESNTDHDISANKKIKYNYKN